MQPADQLDQTPGSTVTFSATVTGTMSPTYIWTFNGQGISDSSKYSGTGTTQLTVTNVQTSDDGNYVLLILDSSAGSPVTFSDAAALSVCKLVCECTMCYVCILLLSKHKLVTYTYRCFLGLIHSACTRGNQSAR